MGVFIDLKKAFNTIDHNILLEKMERYGIRGLGLKWLKSYIMDRKQFVQMGEYKSSLAGIKCGVPQGSILGPKLFIIYINDLCKVANNMKYVVFADDTTIFGTDDNLHRLLENISTEMTKLKLWFDVNKLSVNF